MASSSAPPSLPITIPPLQIYPTISSLRAWRRPLLQASKTLGFVPTMGALHDGHLSLIRAAAVANDAVAVSIFVNPAQFSPSEDLAVYPRTLETDLAQLHALNEALSASGTRGRVEALFLPSVAEMYPSGIPLQQMEQRGAFVSVTPLGSKLEGASRPHFFRGVATVCTKLFNIVQPERAYFGQKDVQQSIILRRMAKDLHIPTEIVVCPTGREPDGLAMSSRNVYLGESRRKVAPILYCALLAAEKVWRDTAPGQPVSANNMRTAGHGVLADVEGLETQIEYFSVADMHELDELDVIQPGQGAVVSAAMRMMPTTSGETVVRILDNVILEGR